MLKPLSSHQASDFRQFLRDAGYTHEEFRSRSGFKDINPGSLPFLLEYTREPNRLNTLLRLFLLGVEVDPAIVRETFPAGIFDAVAGCGLILEDAGSAASSAMITPLDSYWFAADQMHRMRSPDAGDVVLWANATTRVLDLFSIRRPASATLDLGSGCGVISVLAAAHSERVIATDLNPRAEAFTRFNAALNGIENIECFTGDTYEPVKDRTFDRILANPPFFVTPSSDQMFCENSMALDGYCRRVLREGAGMLNEGGFLQMTCEWVQVTGQTWQERLAGWLEATGCDAWVLRSYVRSPEAYANERIRGEFMEGGDKAAARFSSWVAYYRENKVEEICGGMIMIRRRQGANWFRVDELPVEAAEPVGQQVLRVFANQTILSAHPSDAELLGLEPLLVPECRLEHQFQQSGGTWAPAGLRLVLSGGLPGNIAVEWPVAQFLAQCDGKRALGGLIRQTAESANAPVEIVAAQCCAAIRRLAERRFVSLRPA